MLSEQIYKSSKTMSRNKFNLILRFWNFENKDPADKTNQLYKIRKLLNITNDICMFVSTWKNNCR